MKERRDRFREIQDIKKTNDSKLVKILRVMDVMIERTNRKKRTRQYEGEGREIYKI